MRATIKMKLGATFAVVLLLLAGVVGYGINQLGSLNDAMSEMVDDPVTALDRIQQFNDASTSAALAEKSLAMTDDPVMMRSQLGVMRQQRTRADELIGTPRLSPTTPTGRNMRRSAPSGTVTRQPPIRPWH